MDFSGIVGHALRTAFGPQTAVYALAAIGLNLHYGYTGLLNFGQVGFMLVGAFGLAITVVTFGLPFWFGLVMGIVAATVLALILGVPTLRLRADYFAIATIAAAEIIRLTTRSTTFQNVTGGVFGLTGFSGPFYAINPIPRGRYGFGMLSYSHTALWALLVTWALVALASVLVYLLVRSPWGRVVKSIREDEEASRSLGKNVFAYKMQSLVLGGVFGGIGGMMWVLASGSAHPDVFLPQITFYAYAVLIIGGAATRIGPIVGAVIFWFLLSGMSGFMRQAQDQGHLPGFLNNIGAVSLVLVGLALVLLMIYRPQGIFGTRREMALDV